MLGSWATNLRFSQEDAGAVRTSGVKISESPVGHFAAGLVQGQVEFGPRMSTRNAQNQKQTWTGQHSLRCVGVIGFCGCLAASEVQVEFTLQKQITPEKKCQKTNHFSLFGMLSMSGWFGNVWLADCKLRVPPFSLSSEEGTVKQSRAAPVSPSISNKNHHHTESEKMMGERKCACLLLLRCMYCIYSFAFRPSMQLFLFFIVLVLQKEPTKSLCSPSHRVSSWFFKKKDFCFNWSLSVGGWGLKKKKQSQWKLKEDSECDLVWKSGPVFYFFFIWIRQLCWTSGTPIPLRSHLPPCMGSDGCILLQ